MRRRSFIYFPFRQLNTYRFRPRRKKAHSQNRGHCLHLTITHLRGDIMEVPELPERFTLTQSSPCKTSDRDQNSPFKDLPMCHICQASRSINVSKCRFVGQLFPRVPLDVSLTQRAIRMQAAGPSWILPENAVSLLCISILRATHLFTLKILIAGSQRVTVS